MTDEFLAEYIGSGCFTRVGIDGRDELVFVRACYRPEWLMVGKLYRMRVEREELNKFHFAVIEAVGEVGA